MKSIKTNSQLDEILKSIKDNTGIDLKTNKRRLRDVIDAKRIYFYIAKEKTECTLYEIAKYLGMDHATVLHHHKKCEGLMEFDAQYRNLYQDIVDKIPFINNQQQIRDSAANHLIKYRYFKQKLNRLKNAS